MPRVKSLGMPSASVENREGLREVEGPLGLSATEHRGSKDSSRGSWQRTIPRVSIVVPFWGYLLGSLIQNWLNQKKELQWRL